jgi:hypothetical protein
MEKHYSKEIRSRLLTPWLWEISANLHSVTFQKTIIFMVADVRASDLTRK